MGSEVNEYYHGNLEEALIEETTRLIREKGTDAVSMRSLSECLDVSRSAAYRHFDGKSALFAAVAKNGFLKLRDKLRPIRTSPEPDDRKAGQLLSMGQAYVDFALENPAFYRLMFQWDWTEEDFGELSSVSQSTYDELVTLLEEGQSEGVFQSGDAREMAFSTWSLVHGIVLLFLEGHAPDRFQFPAELTGTLRWIGQGVLSEQERK